MGLEETKSKYVWINGKYVPWADANIHICSHVIHYGSGVFEGIRCYKTPKGPAIFRQKEHTDRLFNSAKIYRMDIPFTKEQVNQAMVELIQKNGHEECYVRPIVYRGYKELGVNPFNCPVDIALITWYWGKYLGPEALEQGVDVMVSSWNRMAPNTFPAMAKTCANYMNSQLIKMEAIKYGFVEASRSTSTASCLRARGRTCSSSKTGSSTRRRCTRPSCPASPGLRLLPWPASWATPSSRR